MKTPVDELIQALIEYKIWKHTANLIQQKAEKAKCKADLLATEIITSQIQQEPDIAKALAKIIEIDNIIFRYIEDKK